MAYSYPVIYNEQPYEFTVHAQLRMAQWNLRESDILCVIRYGQKYHRHGILFHFMGKKDIPQNAAKDLARLEGTTVLTADSRTIITVYRNRNALKVIKGKVAYHDPDIQFRRREGYHEH